MINSVNNAVQTVAAGANVLFNVDNVRTRSCRCNGWLAHNLGSGIFTITKGGIYEIEYNAIISSATTGSIGLNLEENGEKIVGTTTSYVVGTANDTQSVSASTLVQVPCGASTQITLGNNSSLAMLITEPSIIIKKVA